MLMEIKKVATFYEEGDCSLLLSKITVNCVFLRFSFDLKPMDCVNQQIKRLRNGCQENIL